MARQTGLFRINSTLEEEVRAFVPFPLPPADPPLATGGSITELLAAARTELARLAVAGSMVPSTDWFLYGFVRKEVVITSRIKGKQATLRGVLTFEGTDRTDRPDDVREVCIYVDALFHARGQLADPMGLLCEAHHILMRGIRGQNKQSSEVRRSQNWIGCSRPGKARFVPPPPVEISGAVGAQEQ